MSKQKPTTLRVTEIFYSLQGESNYSGYPCVFVRLTGCPLRCRYCDSEYAFKGGESLTIPQILDKVDSYSPSLVELTGGEPLVQKGSIELLKAMSDQYEKVLLETSGAIDCSNVPAEVIKILDVKTPGSGEASQMCWHNLEILNPHDEIKFVLTGRSDYEWACALVLERKLNLSNTVHFSPVHGKLEAQTLADWILADRMPVRLHLQLHKMLWPHRTRGV